MPPARHLLNPASPRRVLALMDAARSAIEARGRGGHQGKAVCAIMADNKVLGIILIVLGALLLLGWLSIPYLSTIVGVGLVVLGILMLMGRMPGGTILAVVAIVLGVLLLLDRIPAFEEATKDLWRIITTVVAVLLIVFGAMKVMGK